nr:SIS domain-containing protein [Planosporangium thailandense]
MRRSRAAVADQLADVAAVPDGAVIGLIGVGASEHAARSTAWQWRRQGLRAFAVTASDLTSTTRHAFDVVVAISESGRSVETLQAAELLDVTRSLALVNAADSPLAQQCDSVLMIDSGEDSPVYTTGYTATLQALGQLGDHWSGQASPWYELAEQAAAVLDPATTAVEQVAGRFDDAKLVDVVASSAASATAGEGALILREAARLRTAGHETRNYLHGPMEPLDSDIACLVVGDGREVRLARDVARLGCPALLLTTEAVDDAATAVVCRLPRAHSPLAQNVLDILPIQLLAWSVAQRRGLPVDGFRYHQDDTKHEKR